jgi:hypothetical protein
MLGAQLGKLETRATELKTMTRHYAPRSTGLQAANKVYHPTSRSTQPRVQKITKPA